METTGLQTGRPVAVVGASDPVFGVKKALDLIGGPDIIGKYETFLVKPNYVNDSLPSTGVTTDPYVVKAVVEYVLGFGVSKDRIIVAEGGMASLDTMQTFRKVGLVEALKAHDIRLVDLNKEPHVEVDIPEGKSLKRVNIAKPVLECDCVISVPKLKIHCWSLVTLSMKNMMGAILPKGIMHDDLHQKIVDLNRVIGPELTVIDGIVGCQRHELACDPIRSDVIVASEDFVAADSIGAHLMGLCGEDILHLKLAKKAGMGECGMERFESRGDHVSKLRKHYKL